MGSGIGPTLFIIFVIDLHPIGLTNCITKCADDTSLLVPEKADIDITEELQHILKWAEVNELNINKSKTKKLIYHLVLSLSQKCMINDRIHSNCTIHL